MVTAFDKNPSNPKVVPTISGRVIFADDVDDIFETAHGKQATWEKAYPNCRFAYDIAPAAP
jgi:hypothetical protein